MEELKLALQIALICVMSSVVGLCVAFVARHFWADELTQIWEDY